MAALKSVVVTLAVAAVLLIADDTRPRAQEPGSAPVVPIQITGDPAARFVMVVMGDGYTAAEIPKFRAHLDKHLNVLWSIEPFRSYRNYINVYAVEVVSPESGIHCDPEVREPRNTTLGLQFGGGCTNPNARGITVGKDHQALVREYAARATPHVDQILLIANTDTYGGIGGSLATTSGGNSLGPLITPHELGHSLGRLQDEYTYSARGKPGGGYKGEEPSSIHHTLMTIDEMLAKQAKWFRWLGDESESGGPIARYEGGSQRTTGIWRPSKHSMMISVGYYFDQVSREWMTQRISEQVQLIAASAAADAPVGSSDVLWIETAQPVYHDLQITWRVGDRVVDAPANRRQLDLSALKPAAGTPVTVTVVDPTPFVRDPEIRRTALTASRTWTVGSGTATPPAAPGPAAFTASTQTDRPIGGRDVVSVTTTNPRDSMINVVWQLNGKVVPEAANERTFALARRKLAPGTHSLSATALYPGAPLAAGETRTWTVDNTGPTVTYSLATPVHQVAGARGEPHYFARDEFTMMLEPTDDQPGYVVAEFRVNGDGWHHYYGWPDAPPGTPFKFTPRGTTIKELVYGSLSSEGLSPQPWEPREPGWGTHRIEYRAIDAAGNIGDAKAFRMTIEAKLACTSTVTGTRAGDLEVTSGVACLAPDARVDGHVTVAAGASLVGTRARIAGSLTGSGAATIELVGTTIDGSVKVTRATERLTLFGITVGGDAAIDDTQTMRAALIAGSTIAGALTCTGNRSAPEGGGTTAARGMTGQCADLTQRSAGEPFKRAGYTPDTPGLIGPRVTRQLEPRYTSEAMRQKITGTVELEVTVDSNGRVSDVRVVKSLDALYGLDESAIEAARKWQFTPARLNGKPVPSTVRIVLEFKLH